MLIGKIRWGKERRPEKLCSVRKPERKYNLSLLMHWAKKVWNGKE